MATRELGNGGAFGLHGGTLGHSDQPNSISACGMSREILSDYRAVGDGLEQLGPKRPKHLASHDAPSLGSSWGFEGDVSALTTLPPVGDGLNLDIGMDAIVEDASANDAIDVETHAIDGRDRTELSSACDMTSMHDDRWWTMEASTSLAALNGTALSTFDSAQLSTALSTFDSAHSDGTFSSMAMEGALNSGIALSTFDSAQLSSALSTFDSAHSVGTSSSAAMDGTLNSDAVVRSIGSAS